MTRPTREEQLPPDDEIVELAPGVRRIQLPIQMPGLGHVNCYILDDKRGAALVDPGLPGRKSWQALLTGLRKAGLTLDAVHTVIVTHSHPDHFGNAGRIHNKVGAEIVTHHSFRLWWDVTEEDLDAIDHVASADENTGLIEDPSMRPRGPKGPTPWGGEGYNMGFRRELFYKVMHSRIGKRFFPTPEPTKKVEDADVIRVADREMVAIHTPGHTPDHLCLYDPEAGLLLSGDHVLPTITPHISGLSGSADPLKLYFDSLDRMTTFTEAKQVLPAHGQPFLGLTERVKHIERHHEERLDILRDAGDDLGWDTVDVYMRKLFQERAWSSMAESETFAHLEHLRFAGETQIRRRDDGMLEYSFK